MLETSYWLPGVIVIEEAGWGKGDGSGIGRNGHNGTRTLDPVGIMRS